MMKSFISRSLRLEGIFTRQERMALLFLAGMSLLGMAVMGWRLLCAREEEAALAWRPVSVNRADAVELAALPGIGPVLARRITDDRRLHGPFLVLADMKRVKGITPKTLAKMQSLLRFD